MRRNLLAVLGVLGVILALSLAGPGVAKQSSTATAIGDGTGVSYRLQGCDLPANVALPISGKFICPDADYTDGNLGKNWNELDLVPHRIIIDAGNSAPASQTFAFEIAADNLDGGKTGYDFIENGFEAKSSGCLNVSVSDPQGTAGTNPQHIYRTITLTMSQNTTCQLDLYIRLGVGAHLYPGSSLHTNLLNSSGTTAGIGNKENSIPVNEIEPQSISKDMAASRDANHLWTLVKSPDPATLDFGDVCSSGFASTKGVNITVTWERLAADPSGAVTIVTHVYATNPSHRVITTSVTDKIYEGTAQTTLLNSATASGDVPANTANYLLLTHTASVTNSASHFNDVATGSYIDQVTGVPVPGTTTASADAEVATGATTNESASITDSESITGSGLSFKVPTPSVGSFTGGYVAGTYTTGPVGWDSGVQSGSGSTVFHKTIKLDPKQVTSGTLSDDASLAGSDGASATASASVDISSSATTTLTINKTIPNVLQGTETQTFTFHVLSGATVVRTASITFAAGDTSKSVDVSGLDPGSYSVAEDTATGWNPQTSQDVTLSVPACSNSVTFDNTFGPASAQAAKITDPAGNEAGWVMTLNGPGAPAGGESVTTTGTSSVPFTTVLQEGSYTITETAQSGWTQTNASAGCSFTVNYPADFGKTFSCAITNRSRDHVDLHKTVSGGALSGSQAFTFQLRSGASTSASGTAWETQTVNAATPGGTLTFTTALVPGTTYQMCELVVVGWNTSLDNGGFGPYNPNQDPNYLCVDFKPTGFGTTFHFTVDNTPPPGGEAATIGFWKNWSSCAASKGKQTPVLDQTLAKGDITIGALVLHANDCVKAVNILNKTTVDGKKKMASDPLFNMAAQLLAADLNKAAGANVCSAAATAIAAGQALLVKYGWNGLTYSPALSAADATAAGQLNATLDSYNNNNLC